jgi:hypothetical protein
MNLHGCVHFLKCLIHHQSKDPLGSQRIIQVFLGPRVHFLKSAWMLVKTTFLAYETRIYGPNWPCIGRAKTRVTGVSSVFQN